MTVKKTICGLITLLIFSSLIAFGVGCGQTSVAQTGTLEIRVIDAPPEYDIATIDITFSKVEVHKAGDGEQEGGWITVSIAQGRFDLLRLEANDLEALLATDEVTPGTYTQLRIIIDSISITLNGVGEPPEVLIPSGELKFNRNFEVAVDEMTTLLVDIDAAESLVSTGSGKLLFKPVVKLTIQEGDIE